MQPIPQYKISKLFFNNSETDKIEIYYTFLFIQNGALINQSIVPNIISKLFISKVITSAKTRNEDTIVASNPINETNFNSDLIALPLLPLCSSE